MWGPPRQFFLKALTPLEILAKNMRYPFPWIFNPCASMNMCHLCVCESEKWRFHSFAVVFST
jgi:hypothetical protein